MASNFQTVSELVKNSSDNRHYMTSQPTH